MAKPSEIIASFEVRLNLIDQKVDTKFDDLHYKLDKILKTSYDTLNQTTRTNGRVTALEDETQAIELDVRDIKANIFDLSKWRSKIGGIWFTVLLICGGAATLGGLVIGIVEIITQLK